MRIVEPSLHPTQRKMDAASILVFWPLRRKRQLRPKRTQAPCVASVAMNGNQTFDNLYSP